MSHGSSTRLDRYTAKKVQAPISVSAQPAVDAPSASSPRVEGQASPLSPALSRKRSTSPLKEGSEAQAPVLRRTSDPLKISKAKGKVPAKESPPAERHPSGQVQAQLPLPARRRQSDTVTVAEPILQHRRSTQSLVIPKGLSQEQRYRFQQSAAEAWRREQAQKYAQTLALRKSEKKAKTKAKRKAAREAKRALKEALKEAQPERGQAGTAEATAKRKLKLCAIL